MRRSFRRLAAVLLGVAWLVAARAAAPPAPPQFVLLGVADGVPSSLVYKIVQDHDGFIWIGTQDGLARYDGVGFQVYRHDPTDPGSLASNDVSALLVDRDGRLWCGGEASGLNRLEADGHTFTHWMHRPNDLSTLGSNDLFSIEQDAAGAIWVGTYLGGLNRLEPDDTFTHVDHDAEDATSLRSSNVYALLGDAQGRLWIGTDEGLDVRDAQGRLVHVDLPPMDGRPGPPIIMSFLPEADGSMLVGTRKGLFRVDGALRYREEIAASTPALMVSALARDADGGLWLGQLTGIARLDARGLTRYSTEEAAPGAYPGTRTMDIFRDREGGLWFAVHDGGIARLPPHWANFASFRHAPGDASTLSRARVKAVAVDGSRAVWVASGNDGVDRIDRATGVLERWGERLHLPKKRVEALLADGRHLWVGQRGELRRFDLDTLAASEFPVDVARADALPQGSVDHLVRGTDGSVWVSVLGGGIARIAGEPPRVVRRYTPATHDLDDADITALALDPRGEPWIATASGVEHRVPERDVFEFVAGGPKERIHALAFAADGSLWLHRLGMLENYSIDGGTMLVRQRFDAAKGWPTLQAHALAVAKDGTLWVTSPRGLWRVDPVSRALRRFDARDGLPSQEFIAGALAQADDGTLFGGTLGGLVAFDPPALHLDAAPPRLVITALDVQRGGATVALDPAQPIELQRGDVDLHVVARALSYANSSANRYRFQLAGFDQDWIDTDRGERIWSQLPAGEYRLHVGATSAAGAGTELSPPLVVRVARAPWATPAAYVVYVLVAFAAALLALRSYRQRVRRRHVLALGEERRRAAEQVAEAKSTFLATMGHEIRTPMTGVLGMSELLLGTPLDERQRGYAQAIHHSGQMLLRLVNDSLDIARIDAGKFVLEDQPYDPVALGREVIELEQPVAQAKGVALALQVAEAVPEKVWGDALRIRQILLNLLSNALKFTEHGHVELALMRYGDRLRYRVSDTGPGMAEELQQRLFNRFEQAAGVTRRHGGSGLGLAICRELTVLMGGTISVSSRLGEGTRFDVDLPIYEVPAEQAPAAPVAPAVTPVALDVLLVEDDETVAEVVVGLLGRLGHRAVHVTNGLAALTAFETGRYDLALVDLDLPGIDGLQFARLLRSRGHADLPLVAVTARSVGDEEARIRAAGMDALLRKPLTSTMLAEAIAAAGSSRR
ncbi:hybrid sensor histidine kinase/response regulator [Dokdonella fugitiva]|jgi:signal transduction histidine kinase/streptogramin lyase|uniref:histidine kinase n=1 Tax=Dokdonella fugitiva TaxID=328517 RepID=A0A4R2I055_9GAMM|nr:hybrid sensor histidine kinase/response regulator [Dokdonella fugitiva]MBA8884569.1 signal transduction histidine kinase/streptogramin lyase [Dokdonella fugitiva]TCO37242.1 ligand-binding sensor domain-containing protein [Dokdonella fugitiva]